MSNSSDALLRETLHSVLLAFEAPPSVVDNFRLDNAGSDPFTWTQSFYNFIRIEDGFGLKIKVLFILVGISTILSIATLTFQYCARSQASVRWFFRRHYHTQSKIPYLVPHPVNIVVLASLLTSILLIIYLSFTYDAWSLGKSARLIRVSSWFPSVWFTFYTAVWFSGFGSLYLTYLVPSQYTRRGSLTGVRRHASPLLVNCICFGIPILCITTVLPLQVKQSNEMRTTMRGTKGLNDVLGPLSLAWQTPGGSLDDVSLEVVRQFALNVLEAKRIWETYWTAELALWSFWSLLALAVALPFCLSLVLSTHRRIRRMAKSQSALDQWTTGGFTKHSPPTTHASSVSPPSSLKEGTTSSPTKSIDFIEPLSPSPGSVLSIPPYTSPASSFPPSAVHTPAAYEHSSQPFFTFHSPASFSSKSPSMLDASPAGSPVPLMPQLGRGKSSKSGRSYGRHSIQVLRRMSHSAVFPSRAGGLDLRNRSHLEDLNKRYWHIAAEYTTVLLVMVLICAFALFELASQSKLLMDCSRKVLSTIVVSFAYTCLVNAWLTYNLYRLYRDAQKYTPSRSGSSSGSSSSEGARRCTEPIIFGENIFPEKRTSKSMVHFSDMIRNGSQYEPDRRPSSSPPPSVVHNEDDDIEDRRKSRDLSGLKIEIITSDAQRHNHTQRPTVTGPTLHQSFERRRSSYRAPSMDLTEALALAPVSLHRRCSTHR